MKRAYPHVARTLALLLGLIFTTAAVAAPDIRVVDGDTIHVEGEKIRLLGLDTPEKGHQAECLAERMLSRLATERLTELLADGIIIERDGVDRYGRTLAVVKDGDGRDVAEVLVSEGYGKVWEGRQVDWCR